MDDQGNLERTWKVREESGNLKINGYGRQSPENLFVLSSFGATLKGKNLRSWGANSFLYE